MPDKLSPSAQLLYCATRLTALANDLPIAHGTGFFYRALVEGKSGVDLLVTNKHVLDGATSVHFNLHLGNGQSPPGPAGEFRECGLRLAPGGLIDHPDPNIDLCAVSMGQFHSPTHFGGRLPFWCSLNRTHIPSPDQWAELDAIEPLVMVGCPSGLFDEVNSLPLVRRGITASDPARRFNGRDEFMIDLACFPGSSGSPVFLYDLGGASFDKKTGGLNMGKVRASLLGILQSGPVWNAERKMVLGQRPRIETAIMMHLGTVIRSTALLEIDRLAVARATPQANPATPPPPDTPLNGF